MPRLQASLVQLGDGLKWWMVDRTLIHPTSKVVFLSGDCSRNQHCSRQLGVCSMYKALTWTMHIYIIVRRSATPGMFMLIFVFEVRLRQQRGMVEVLGGGDDCWDGGGGGGGRESEQTRAGCQGHAGSLFICPYFSPEPLGPLSFCCLTPLIYFLVPFLLRSLSEWKSAVQQFTWQLFTQSSGGCKTEREARAVLVCRWKLFLLQSQHFPPLGTVNHVRQMAF